VFLQDHVTPLDKPSLALSPFDAFSDEVIQRHQQLTGITDTSTSGPSTGSAKFVVNDVYAPQSMSQKKNPYRGMKKSSINNTLSTVPSVLSKQQSVEVGLTGIFEQPAGISSKQNPLYGTSTQANDSEGLGSDRTLNAHVSATAKTPLTSRAFFRQASSQLMVDFENVYGRDDITSSSSVKQRQPSVFANPSSDVEHKEDSVGRDACGASWQHPPLAARLANAAILQQPSPPQRMRKSYMLNSKTIMTQPLSPSGGSNSKATSSFAISRGSTKLHGSNPMRASNL